MNTTTYDRLLNLSGTKFVGFLLAGFGLLIGAALIDDTAKLKLLFEAIAGLFLTYVTGNAANTLMGAAKDVLTAGKQPPEAEVDDTAPERAP